MQRAETLTIEQIERFLAASEGVRLRALDREEIYSWVEGTLRGAAVRETSESHARVAVAVPGQDDGSELCADGPAGEAVSRARAGEGERLSPASVSATLHARGY